MCYTNCSILRNIPISSQLVGIIRRFTLALFIIRRIVTRFVACSHFRR